MPVVQIGNLKRTIPESWNALPLHHQLECYNILSAGSGSIFEPAEVPHAKRISLTARLLDLTDAQMNAWQQDCQRAAESEEEGNLIFYSELDEVLALTNFLFTIEEDERGNTLYQVKMGLTKCPWPKLQYKSKKGKQKRYYAPADKLENITLYEMAYTFSLFERYLENNDPADADELIAAIYRPAKPKTPHNKRSGYEGDRRLPLYKHEGMIPKRKKRIAELPIETKRLLLFWFASCRQHIVDSYENIFQPPKAMELAGEKVGNDYGWGGMLLSLAGGIVHLDQISMQPYSDGLIYLSYLEDQRQLTEMRQAFSK